MRILLTGDRTQDFFSLKNLLEQEGELTIIGIAIDAQSLHKLVLERQPDVVMLDWDHSELCSDDVLSLMRGLRPGLKVMGFSHRDEACREALAAGVDAFVTRDTPLQWLLVTLRTLGQLSPYYVG
jgi:DNA-binding NarL/FixJ family response regulator